MNTYQDLPARIERVRAHTKTRRGRRDFAALKHLVDLQRVLAGHKASTTYSMNELLKNVYSDVNVPPDHVYVFAPNPMYALIKKQPRDPHFPERPRYVQPVETLMPRIVDDEPPIKSHPASKDYRENWDRIFGDASGSSQDVEARQVAPVPEAFAGPFCCGCGVGLLIEKPLNTCEDCYKHDSACAKLCTESANCNCGA
jgi:hypothetical protein